MPTSTFLRDHWQKKPLVVRGAFPGFRDPISPDELAGLSCEPLVESRIVREKGGRRPWEVTYGPQDEAIFSRLPERGWTILVQEVNRWVPDAALLLDAFSFVPNVRVDDVMVSFAEPGGSVGAHLDSYDVFLVQGQGERRWRFHTRPTKNVTLRSGLDLRILEHFEPDADAILGPGDLLYLPPGFAHHGVAVSPCLTYSIGFRSPSAGEAWSSFVATAATSPEASRLLVDPPLAVATEPGAIPPALLERVRAMVRSMDMSDTAIDRWFASFATRLKPGHTMKRPRPSARWNADAILARVARGEVVTRSEEGRWAYLPAARKGLTLFVGGVEIRVEAGAVDLARTLSSARRHDGGALTKLTKSASARSLLVELFMIGALGFAPKAPRG